LELELSVEKTTKSAGGKNEDASIYYIATLLATYLCSLCLKFKPAAFQNSTKDIIFVN
jgi:hypothetical protein